MKPFSIITLALQCEIAMEMWNQEKYSRGWRGAPAKGVGRVTGARVQIPLSPLLFQSYFFLPLEYNREVIQSKKKAQDIVYRISKKTYLKKFQKSVDKQYEKMILYPSWPDEGQQAKHSKDRQNIDN